MIKLSRAYSNETEEGFRRILVDRLWPRGISKEKLGIDSWMGDIAPSGELRKWFSHDPEKWDEFRERYFSELDSNLKTMDLIRECREHDVALVFSARDQEHNNAVALKEWIEGRLKD